MSPSAPCPMIKVEQLRKEFTDLQRGTVPALAGVSFEVKSGEIYGLLGPNGAGKTTCLRILSTVLKPTSGRATVDGYDVVRDPEQVRSRIGFMSNNTGLYDRMTAQETVEHFGRLYGLSEDLLQERIDEIFTALQMNDFRETLSGKMSTGMKQKVSIARTLVHDPPVLIFDEPTSGLDVLVARAVLDTIDGLRSKGKSIIFSTHIMHEVRRLCDRISIIHKGHLLTEGTVAELEEAHGEPDLDELFYRLVSDFEADPVRFASRVGLPPGNALHSDLRSGS